MVAEDNVNDELAALIEGLALAREARDEAERIAAALGADLPPKSPRDPRI